MVLEEGQQQQSEIVLVIRPDLLPRWQDEYGAFTKSHSHRGAVIEYIRNQVEHHTTKSFADELKRFLGEEGVEFDERYLR